MNHIKKTKIIASIWPATRTEEKIIDLYKAGVNVIRINFSHADYDNSSRIIDIVHRLNSQGITKLALLWDLKWPEIRTGDYEGNKTYQKGDTFKIRIDGSKVSGNDQFCDYPYFVEDSNIGDIVKIESGLFDVVIKEKKEDHVVVEALHDASLKQRRHINLPALTLKLPWLIDQDKENVLFCIEKQFDYIAMSFVRSKEHVTELRTLLDEHGASHIYIISKIENQEWLNNIQDIVEASDGIMVARWDLGIEIPIETIPVRQRSIVKLCRAQWKISIIATQMIESMMEHPFPTRAEVSDIFNAIVQKTDAIMLSGETALWQYPIEAVQMMKKIAIQAESVIDYKHEDFEHKRYSESDIDKKYLIKSAIEIAEKNNISAIITFTKSGKLARIAAAYRPKTPLFAFTNRRSTLTQTALLFGVTSRFLNFHHHSEVLGEALQTLIAKGDITGQDKIIVITDTKKWDIEIPTMEIISVKNFLE